MKNPPSRSVILLVWAAILATLLIAGSDPVSGQASKQVQSVGTLGDLKARRPVVREVIEVRNGSSTNLWAAPRTFVHDPDSTDSADDVYVVTNAAASGRYTATDRSTGIIDPRHFGAIPDDLYDDTTPMLAAFAAAGTRASVYIPQGRFIITSPLPLVDRLHVHGEGDGSMIAVGNTNGIAFWNATPGTRVYEVFLENFAINTALGARGNIAISLTNVSYARIEKVFIHAYDGLGFRVGVSPWGDSPSSVGGAWSSSMTGCKIYVYPRPGEPAYAFYGDGGPEWGHGPNSWRIIDNYLNIQPVIAGGITNYGTAVAYANNQNGIQFTDNIFEGYYTNSILMEGGAASSVIGNRFEVSYGIGGTNFAAIRMNNMTNVFIAGNMSQGLGDVTKYVRGVNSSYTLFDAASGSPNTIDGDLILGKTWNVDNTGYLPTVDRFLLLDSTEPLTTMGIGLRTIDSTTNNPRAVMTLNANPTNGQSWAGIWHASTPGAIPFYFYQQNQTNLAITATGSGVLGLPTTSAALSVYGNGAFGSAPAVTGGWTDMSEGVWVRTTDLADKAGFHAIINDGVTNRRIEMKISSTNAAISTTATTAGLPLDLWVSGVNPFSVDTTGVRIKTNLFFSSGTSLFLGGDTIDDFTGAGLSVVGGKLTASGGTGDVVGPASSTDATLAVFMGTTGKVITNTPAITATNVQTITAAVAAYEPLNANKYQSTNANLTTLAGAGSTGGGAFVRADSPTVTGTWAFDLFAANTLTVLSNLYAVTVAYGAGWNGSSNVPTRDAVYDEMELRAPKASPALTGTPTVNSTNLMAAVHERVLRAGDTMTGTLTLSGTAAAGTSNTVAASTKYVDDAVAAGGTAGFTPSIMIYTNAGNYTWTNPSPSVARKVTVRLMGPGGGGGSGRRGAAGSVRCGGGGGGSGAYTELTTFTTFLGATEPVTNGTPGVGGAAITADDSNGTTATAGTASQFGLWAYAGPGGAGGGGTTAAGTAGAGPVLGQVRGNAGGAASGTGGAGAGGSSGTTQSPMVTASSAGAGGGLTTGDAASNGGAGGQSPGWVIGAQLAGGTAGAASGGAGGNGNSFTRNAFAAGSAGGGGASHASGAAGSGGNGGFFGAGGGGGAASLNGNNSGKGGNGAIGFVIVIVE